VTAFVVRRLIWLAITLWIVFTVSFVLMRSVPGGPFTSERALDPAVKRQIEARYHLDDPPLVQYFDRLGEYLRLDLGESIKLADYTVNQIIAEGFPISASLGILATVFAVLLGVMAGTIAAVWRGTLIDLGFMSIATIGIALPGFLIASFAILLFVFIVPLFPAGGWGKLENLVLPAMCLGAPYAAYIARLSRTGMLDVLGQDYIRTAYAKGLPRHTVIVRHALKGAILPVVSYLGPAIAGILTGSLVVEQIFAIPGLGTHFVQSAIQRDYPLSMGLVMLYTVILYTLNFLVDLSYTFLDPRVKLS
jgi:oligopeptide transport system permease protein